VNAFAAFVAAYLPSATIDELILSVEAKIESDKALPQGHS
jgi:hypothetical protein